MNEIAKPTDPMAEFKAKLTDKVRADIAAMLPDEVIDRLVQQAVQEQFFEPRKIHGDYGRFTIEPSWFVAEVSKAAKPVLDRMIGEYVAANEDVLKRALEEFCSAQNLLLIAMGAMGQRLQMDMLNAINNLPLHRHG